MMVLRLLLWLIMGKNKITFEFITDKFLPSFTTCNLHIKFYGLKNPVTVLYNKQVIAIFYLFFDFKLLSIIFKHFSKLSDLGSVISLGIRVCFLSFLI